MGDVNRIAPGKRTDEEQQVEIGAARPSARSPVRTTHQFATNKARGAGREGDEANAAEAEDDTPESNQTRGESKETKGPERATPR